MNSKKLIQLLLIKPYHLVGYTLEYLASRFTEFHLTETVVISGSPRGGTTWLMEILSAMRRYKYVFEPFHREWFPRVKEIGLSQRPFLPPNKKNDALQEFLYDVFTGKEISHRPDLKLLNFREALERLTASRLVVKFIRANRVLPWMVNNIPVKATYFIIRHPCATIASQIKSNITGYVATWDRDYIPSKKEILKEASQIPTVREDTSLMNKLNNVTSSIGWLAVVWSLDNLVPLEYMKENPSAWHPVVYERLVTHPDAEIQGIFGAVDIEIPSSVYRKFTKPSKTAIDREYIGTPKQLVKWKNQLSQRQIAEILRITQWFGIDFYTEEPEPDYDLIKRWGFVMDKTPAEY